MTTAIILAGGLGTRLRGTLPDLPKPMAPVAGRPFLAHQLDHWIAQGVVRFVLSVGYRAVAISNHFGDRYRGVPIDYVVEPAPLGTGGALALAATKLRSNEPALLLNGDTYFDVDFPRSRRTPSATTPTGASRSSVTTTRRATWASPSPTTAASPRCARTVGERERRRVLVPSRGARCRRARARPGRLAGRRRPAVVLRPGPALRRPRLERRLHRHRRAARLPARRGGPADRSTSFPPEARHAVHR